MYLRPMQANLRSADVVPVGAGCHAAPEAARLPATTPLWRPQLPRLGDSLEIGFHDLIELRFVLAFPKQNLGLNVVRRGLENAPRIVGEERPFSTHRVRTDGKDIFLESLREIHEHEDAVVGLKTPPRSASPAPF